MGKKHSEVVLFSGGWDSTLCALKHPNAELLFVNYGQNYVDQELKTAQKIAEELNKKLIVVSIYLGHDAKNRNFNLIMIARGLGFDKIIVGVRNLFPAFDKYKDSNWWSIFKFGRDNNINIKTPIIGYKKKFIVKGVLKKIKTMPYNCYKNNEVDCDCVNCVEMRNILK